MRFIASFAFVLQRCKQRGHRVKPIPLCRAGVYSRRLFRFKAFITAGAHLQANAPPPYDVIPL